MKAADAALIVDRMYPINFLLRAAQRAPTRPAIRSADGEITYGQLVEQVLALAAALQSNDADPRSLVAICAGDHPMHVVAILATLAAGKIWVALNPRAGSSEIARIVDVTEPSVVIVDEHLLEKVDAPGARLIVHRPRRSSGGATDLAGLIDRHAGRTPSRIQLPLHETQAIKFTGGTTGVPKGVMQSYRAWNTVIVSMMQAWRLDAEDRYLAAAPLTHGASTFLLPLFGQGGCLVLPRATKAADILDSIESERITTLFMPPTLIYAAIDEARARKRNLSSLKQLIYSAAPMRPEKIREAQEVFGPLATCYGQTEAPAIVTFLRPEELRRPENLLSVGRAGPLAELAIMDRDGRFLGPGEHGEVVVRGDIVMSGYWRQPEKTAETIIDGWLHTGDGGVLDEHGCLFLKNRLRDVIITGGFNVYPSDVENALGRHPAVFDCLVVGIEDDKWGEAVHAAVQLREGWTASETELIGHVKAMLDSVKAPKAVHFFAALPRNPVGKLAKTAIKDAIVEGRRAAGAAAMPGSETR